MIKQKLSYLFMHHLGISSGRPAIQMTQNNTRLNTYTHSQHTNTNQTQCTRMEITHT